MKYSDKLPNRADIIFVYLDLGDLVIAIGKYNNGDVSFQEKCKCYQHYFYDKIEVDLKTNIKGFAFLKEK